MAVSEKNTGKNIGKQGTPVLNVGNPGNKGGTGRPKNEWKEICRDLVSSEERIATAREILADKSHPAWIATMKWFGEQGYGKPTEESNVNLTVKEYIVVNDKDWTEEV